MTPFQTLPAAGRRQALRTGALAALAIGLAGCVSPVVARGSPLQLEVVDRSSGEPLTPIHHQGKDYVAGLPGSRYALRLSNRSPQRMLVVLSVDGVNVVSGETAGVDQVGYVIEPWQSHDIAGWRKSDRAVAAFEFAALSQSYAALTGRPGNVGVIGAAVFFEKTLPPPIARKMQPQILAAPPAGVPAAPSAEGSRAEASDARDVNGAMKSAAPGELRARLGTGHGAQEWSVSRRTRFERSTDNPVALVEITYDSSANLAAAGIVPRRYYAQPRPFPQSDAWPGFVPDPQRR